MGLISEEVEVGLNNVSAKYYEEKGYKIPWGKNKKGELVVTRGTSIIVKTKDLPNNNCSKVKVKCDGKDCIKILSVRWIDYLKCVKKNNKYYCNRCASLLYGGISHIKLSKEDVDARIKNNLGSN